MWCHKLCTSCWGVSNGSELLKVGALAPEPAPLNKHSCCLLTGPTVQVPPQPLWFAPGLANVRKLQELPYHLLHAGLWEELRQEVIGKM